MDLWGEVGTSAGHIHTVLSKSMEPMTIAVLKKKSKLNNEMLYLGIGWLMREEKIDLHKAGKSQKVSLKN